MGTKYSSVSISGYNTSPPVDDGTISEANKVKWSGVKTKLADPVKTAVESINTAVAGSIGTVIARSSNTQIAASNHDDCLVCTSTFSQTFVGASTLGAGWRCYIVNNGTGTITLTPNGTETINGKSILPIYPGQGGSIISDGSNIFFMGSTIPAKRAGECRLVKSGANLLLSPFNGDKIFINGEFRPIPASCTLAPTSLSASTLYYIYAYVSSGAVALAASATGYTIGSDGIAIKTGDAAYSLVGMARTNGSTAWADTDAQRFVRTWFNDQGIIGQKYATGGDISFGADSWTEISTTARTDFLSWSGEKVSIRATASAYDSGAAGASVYCSAGYDGSPLGIPSIGYLAATGASFSMASEFIGSALSEGYHYAQVFGVITGETTSFYNDEYCSTTVVTSGSGA